MDGVPRNQTSVVKKATVDKKQNNSNANTESIAGIGKNSKPAQYWNEIVNNLKNNGKIMLYTNLLNTNAVEINDMTFGIEFPKGITPFGKTVLNKPESITEISNQVSIACGKEMHIKYIDTKPQQEKMSEEQELSDFANGFDSGYEEFKIGMMIKEMRLENGMTQEQLAEKLNTKKSVISRMENHSEDIRLSTLQKVAAVFGKQLRVAML